MFVASATALDCRKDLCYGEVRYSTVDFHIK
jgi:hypothetical protein